VPSPKRLEPLALNRLNDIKVPLLTITADLDMPCVSEASKLIVSNVKGAANIHIPGSGHLVNMEKPAEFNKAVCDYILNQNFHIPGK
jgi:3-oxoadipate enol-lactonase